MGRPPLGQRPMTVAERVRRHRLLQEGKAARVDRINDATRAALSADPPDERAKKLEAMQGSWSRWLMTRSGGSVDQDTRRLFASALAELEQRAQDDAAMQIGRLIRQMQNW